MYCFLILPLLELVYPTNHLMLETVRSNNIVPHFSMVLHNYLEPAF